MQPALSCTGIGKTFLQAVIPAVSLQDRLLHARKHRRLMRIDALKDICLAVAPGEWVGLYGHNGSGKTTLLKILAGLMVPDSGTVARHGRLSGFFELGVGFHDERSAEENVRLHAILQGMTNAGSRALVDDIIAFAGVESHRSLPLKCFSTGMRMRLGFAAAAHVDADIYLFDEVFAVGDDAFRVQCDAHFRALRASGKTAVLVSPQRHELDRYCDRVITLDHGAVVAEHLVSAA